MPQVGSYPELGRQLSTILETIENARVMLRQESGTVVADSVFISFRRELRDQIVDVVERFNDQDFQADIWPTGAAAQARWRAQQRPEGLPTPEEEARADSIVSVLRAHGVWVTHAEGDTYFSAEEEVLIDRLGLYLTDGMRDFLRMQVVELRRPTVEDAALMIALDELTSRSQSAERFLQANPELLVSDVVESRYRWYLAVYLAGLPNTRAFDWRTGELKPEWRESMEQYVADYWECDSAELVSRYLGLLYASDFKRSEEIDAYLSELWATIRLVRFP